MKMLVIGNEGAGKSVLAAKLSMDLGLPVINLDRLTWAKNFRKMPEPAHRQRLAEHLREPRLILEGWGLQSTMRERIEWAEVIIYLCYTRDFCIRSVARRNLDYNYRTYPFDDFEGDRLAHAAFFNELVNRIHDEYEPQVQVWLKDLEDKKKVFTFYSREDLERHYGEMVARFKRLMIKREK